MRSRVTTALLVIALVLFATAGAYAASGHLGLAKGKHHAKKHSKAKHHAKKHSKHGVRHHVTVQPQTSDDSGQSSAQSQYGTRPGKGCGDTNHVHTGPPGNPSNTACPPQSKHTTTTTTTTATKKAKAKKAKKAKRHHARKRGHRH